ncbi:TPA: hypothetical protein NWA12_002823 [Escherichia coli]|nr:hypothetical protein [Escherichia coli]
MAFASPAKDYVERGISLDAELISHQPSAISQRLSIFGMTWLLTMNETGNATTTL